MIDKKLVLESEMKFNPNDARTLKIERFKKKQELTKNAQEILKKIEIERKKEKDVEELEREYYSLFISQNAMEVIEEIKHLKEELNLLEYAEKNIDEKKLEEIREQRKTAPDSKPNIIQIPVNLDSQRQQVLNQVFMNRNPPTKSLDEFAQEEMKKLQIQSDKEKQKKEEKKDSDDEEEQDKKTMKDREFDDWKDWHPRGMGNMKK